MRGIARGEWIGLAAGLLLFATAVALASEIALGSRNTLAENGRWLATKPLMEMSLMGAQHFVDTRNALHRNRLDLGAWHGIQEVHWNRPLDPGEIAFRFQLDPGAWLCAIANRDATGFDAIRLSRRSDTPSALLRVDRSGAFREKRPLAVPELGGAWHALRLRFSEREVAIELDGRRVGALAGEVPRPQLVGLRGGIEHARVDDVEIRARGGEIVVAEDFRNRRGRAAVLLGSAALLGLGVAGIALAGARAPRERLLRALTAQLALLFVAGAYLAFDACYWTARYPYAGFASQGRSGRLSIAFERIRALVAGAAPGRGDREGALAVPPAPELLSALTRWNPGAGRLPWEAAVVFRGHPAETEVLPPWLASGVPPKPPGALRLVIVGTSQSWGVGAEVLADTWARRVHDTLAPRLPPDLRLETWNTAQPGARSRQLFDRLGPLWAQLAPDLVVIALASNDRSVPRLVESLQRFARATRALGGDALLVLEPNVRERGELLRERHLAMQRVARTEGLEVLDLQGYLGRDDVHDSGFLWWDFVHLSSYGQALAAERISRELEPRLRAAAEKS